MSDEKQNEQIEELEEEILAEDEDDDNDVEYETVVITIIVQSNIPKAELRSNIVDALDDMITDSELRKVVSLTVEEESK